MADVLSDLRKITSDKQAGFVKFDDGRKLKVDLFSASAMVKLYDAVNDKNKKTMEDGMNAGSAKFMKFLDFAMSKVGSK